MSSFNDAFTATVGKEGRYSNNPADSGGPTMYGITQVVARANGYYGPMMELPLAKAQAIYKSEYWDTLNLDKIDALSPAIAAKLFDIGVNMGTGTAGRFLQRALNVLNRGGTDWPDVQLGNPVGPRTIYAFTQLHEIRGDEGLVVLLRAINCQQGERYISIGETAPKNEAFEFGWFDNRIT